MFSTLAPWFLLALALSAGLTPFVAHLARRLGIVDKPDGGRKRHTHPIPLLGGLAPFVALVICLVLLLTTSNQLTSGLVTPPQYIGFLVGGLILMIGGYLDDKYRLPPVLSLMAPVLASLVAVVAGVNVSKLTNPLGGFIYLTHFQSDLLVYVWLLLVMYTTKLLDGLDGLSTGVSSVGVGMILLLSLTVAYFQPDVAVFAAVTLGSLLGFLVWNAPPAKVFLGEGGSLFVGYALGILAVISGGKLAIALLAVGIPLLDVAWVVVRRLMKGGPSNIVHGDRGHLHHRLLDAGWSPRQVWLAYLVVAGVFGGAALFLQSRQKLVALGVLVFLMIVVIVGLARRHPYAKSPAS